MYSARAGIVSATTPPPVVEPEPMASECSSPRTKPASSSSSLPRRPAWDLLPRFHSRPNGRGARGRPRPPPGSSRLARSGARAPPARARAPRRRRHGPERPAAGERVETPVPGPARSLDDAPENALGLLRRIARLLAPGRRDDRVPPDVGRELPSRGLLRGDEPRGHVRLAVDRLGVEVVALGVLRVDEDRVVLRGPAAARLSAVVI